MNIQTLRNGGINYSDGLERMMGKHELYDRLLLTFSKDKTSESAVEEMKNENYVKVTDLVHSLKGVSGNLSVVPVYDLCCEIMEHLRKNELENVPHLLERLLRAQNEAAQVIIEASKSE